jgi:hypothetical protein
MRRVTQWTNKLPAVLLSTNRSEPRPAASSHSWANREA